METGSARNRESAYVWVCEYCVADSELCKEACIMSYRIKWRQHPEDHFYWERRYTKRNFFGQQVRSKHFSQAAFERSHAALYARREVAQEFACPKRDFNRYGDPGPSWQLHDEFFYKYGYDVPMPYFMQNANRAAWLRIPESALSERDRISEFEMSRCRAAANDRKRRVTMATSVSRSAERQCMAGA